MTGGPIAQAGPSTPTTTATQFYPLPPPNTMAPYSLHGVPTSPYFRQNYYSFFNTSIIHPQAQASMASHGIYVTLDRDVPHFQNQNPSDPFSYPSCNLDCHQLPSAATLPDPVASASAKPPFYFFILFHAFCTKKVTL